MTKILNPVFFTIFLFIVLTQETINAQIRPWIPLPEFPLSAKGTGQTTGHVITLTLENNSSRAQTVEIPALQIPATATHQGYIVPEPSKVTVPAGKTIEHPLTGYCTDPQLPPPAGSSLPPLDTWLPGSPLITQVQEVIRVIPALQANGTINTPFSASPEREIPFLIQQTVWWYSAGAAYDPCIYITQALNNVRDTDWYNIDGDGEETFVSQVVDALIRIGQATGSSEVSIPVLPPNTSPVTPASPSTNPQITNTIRAVGTGQTTGHIADITVHNPTRDPISVQIGDGNPLYIPATGNYQPYAVPSIPAIPVEPGQTVTVPVIGYCVDVRRPPVGTGEPMPPISSWIGTNPQDMPSLVYDVPQVPDEMNPPTRTVRNPVQIPIQTAAPLADVIDLLENLPPPRIPGHWDCPELPPGTGVLIPGTTSPVRTPVNPETNPGVAVPILLDAINRIVKTTDQLMNDGVISTPFTAQPAREREAVIQQTFWLYSADLSGQPYTKKDFTKKTEDQFQSSTGRPTSSLPPAQKVQLDAGVDDFWNSFQAVGVEAKVLPDVPATPPPSIPTEILDVFDNYKGGVNQPPGLSLDEMTPTTGPVFQQRPDEDDNNKKKSCDLTSFEVDFNITLVRKVGDGIESYPATLRAGRYVIERTTKNGFQKDDLLIITCTPRVKCECKGELRQNIAGGGRREESWDYGDCDNIIDKFEYSWEKNVPAADYLQSEIDSITMNRALERLREEKAIIDGLETNLEGLKADLRGLETELRNERDAEKKKEIKAKIDAKDAEIKSMAGKIADLKKNYDAHLKATQALINKFYGEGIKKELVDENIRNCRIKIKMTGNRNSALSIKYTIFGRCIAGANADNCKDKPFEASKTIEITATR